MARNRKRAKERRTRQGQPVASGRSRERPLLPDGDETEQRLPGDAEIGLSDAGSAIFRDEPAGDGAAEPIGQAAPDAEVAEARVAIASRLEPAAPSPEEQVGGNGQAVDVPAPTPSHSSAVAAPRPWLGERLLGFLEGSWRELQRVQWPDRRQVMQATGVVIGFVIVAAAFLGLADFVAPKVVHFVIYGK